MATFHDEVEIEDFEYNEETGVFTYPCPCGDLFSITRDQLEDGEDIARCPSCSLIVRVIYDEDDFASDDEEGEPPSATDGGGQADSPKTTSAPTTKDGGDAQPTPPTKPADTTAGTTPDGVKPATTPLTTQPLVEAS